MQLSGGAAKSLFSPGRPEAVRPASYDVGIGYMYVDGKEYTDDFPPLAPQRAAVLVSLERISIPDEHVGYALPKTGLCNRGILTLSTGIVDPGWSGRISTVAINFGAEDVALDRGEPFLRLVVHETRNEPVDATRSENDYDDKKYLKERKDQSRHLPNTFLDIPRHVEELGATLLRKQTNRLLLVFALVSVFAVLLTFSGAVVVDRMLPTPAASSRLEKLEDRVRVLELENAAQRGSQTESEDAGEGSSSIAGSQNG